jgi:hypothetical protein
LKKTTYIRLENDELVTLNQLASHPGIRIFLQEINISKTSHKPQFNVAVHYPKEHHGMPIDEGWFLLTTFSDLNTAVQTYATIFQLEEMFRDFKLSGFNLELTQLNGSRFDAWFLLLTLVYSVMAFNGVCTTETEQKYLVRTDNAKRQAARNSIITVSKVALFYKFDWGFLVGEAYRQKLAQLELIRSRIQSIQKLMAEVQTVFSVPARSTLLKQGKREMDALRQEINATQAIDQVALDR